MTFDEVLTKADYNMCGVPPPPRGLGYFPSCGGSFKLYLNIEDGDGRPLSGCIPVGRDLKSLKSYCDTFGLDNKRMIKLASELKSKLIDIMKDKETHRLTIKENLTNIDQWHKALD